MHRRRFIHAATLAGVSLPLAGLPALAQSTPSPASGDASIADRAGAIPPETLFEALISTPVTTPLVPSDIAGVTATVWDDTNDSDLAGAVGGVAFVESGGSAVLVGNAIVQPDADAARQMLQGLPSPATLSEFLGMPWATFADVDYAVSFVQAGYLVLAGGSEAPWDPDATPDAATTRKLQMRAIDNLVMLVDHLDDVLTQLGA